MTRTRHQTLGTYTEFLSMISDNWSPFYDIPELCQRSDAPRLQKITPQQNLIGRHFVLVQFQLMEVQVSCRLSTLSSFNSSTEYFKLIISLEYLTVFCFELVNVANQFEARNTTFKSNRFLLNILPFLSKDIFTESMSKRICETKVNFLFFNFSKTVFPHREF